MITKEELMEVVKDVVREELVKAVVKEEIEEMIEKRIIGIDYVRELIRQVMREGRTEYIWKEGVYGKKIGEKKGEDEDAR